MSVDALEVRLGRLVDAGHITMEQARERLEMAPHAFDWGELIAATGMGEYVIEADQYGTLVKALDEAGYYVTSVLEERNALAGRKGMKVEFRRRLTEDDLARANLRANEELRQAEQAASAAHEKVLSLAPAGTAVCVPQFAPPGTARSMDAPRDLTPVVSQPAAPEPSFADLSRDYILHGGIERKDRMTDAMHLTIDGNGDYHWDPPLDVKLFDPPTPDLDRYLGKVSAPEPKVPPALRGGLTAVRANLAWMAFLLSFFCLLLFTGHPDALRHLAELSLLVGTGFNGALAWRDGRRRS